MGTTPITNHTTNKMRCLSIILVLAFVQLFLWLSRQQQLAHQARETRGSSGTCWGQSREQLMGYLTHNSTITTLDLAGVTREDMVMVTTRVDMEVVMEDTTTHTSRHGVKHFP